MSAPRDARLEGLAADLAIEYEFLQLCVREGAVREEELTDDTPAHSAAAMARLRRMERLCLSLDVDVFAGSIIVDLLERLERLEEAQRGPEPARRGTES